MSRYILLLTALALLASCAAQRKRSEWDSIDYSKIARERQARENDTLYTQPVVPSAVGCIDDDLINCSRRGSY